MNIQNLNQQEVEQLQALLNKMNPTQPAAKVYLDPVNKMIDDIVDAFDFDKVQITMDYLGWKWVGKYVTVEMLKEEARRLLDGAAFFRLYQCKNEHWELGVMNSTGGFQATAYCNQSKTKITGLDLKFVLTEWDEETKD